MASLIAVRNLSQSDFHLQRQLNRKAPSSQTTDAKQVVDSVNANNYCRVKELLESGADPNQGDAGKMDCPILVAAIGKGFTEIAMLLIEQDGIDCNLCRNDRTTPLIMAGSRGHDEIVQKLLHWPGIDINARNSNGSTALIVSARAGHVATVKMLLDSGADRQCVQYTKLTALHFAAREGHVEIVHHLLCDCPADFADATDQHGYTALMYCCQRDLCKVAERLLTQSSKRGDSKSRLGGTALHVAAFHNSVKCMKLLLSSGKLDPNLKDSRGRTAIDVAKSRDCEQLLLRQRCSAAGEKASAEAVIPPQSLTSISLGPTGTTTGMSTSEFSCILHNKMLQCGFTEFGAVFQAALADILADDSEISEMRQRYDKRRASGSFADGWGSNLSRMNGSLSRNSDVDMSVERKGVLHVNGTCECPNVARTFDLIDGFLQVDKESGDQPSKTDLGVGVRPPMDFCPFMPCCKCPFELAHRLPDRFRSELPDDLPVEFVRSVRPDCPNAREMRISCTSPEKTIMRKLNTCQGQVSVLVKYILKYIVTSPGLKSYHAKTLMFFLICEIPEQDWQPCRLEELVLTTLSRFEQFVRESEPLGKSVCMPHFFLANTSVYFKSGAKTDRAQLLQCLKEVRSELRRVLIYYDKNHLRPMPGDCQEVQFVFHPFILFELVTPFQRPLKMEGYRHVYPMIYKILADINDPEFVEYDSLIKDIKSLPDFAKTAREVLKVLMHLKLNESSTAKAVLQAAKHIKASRSVVFKECNSVNEAKEYVRCQLEKTNSAWKFCFCFSDRLQLNFLEGVSNCGLYQLPGYLLLDHTYFVNFDAMLKTLCLSLIPDSCPSLLGDWFTELRSVEDGDDIFELSLFAKHSNCPEQLKYCQRRMAELSVKLDEEMDMIDAVRCKLELLELSADVLKEE